MTARNRKPAAAPSKPTATPKPIPPEPAITAPVSDDEIRGLLVKLYRGTMPDISHLTADQKQTLKILLDADTKAEIIFRYPERESLRQILRVQLGE